MAQIVVYAYCSRAVPLAFDQWLLCTAMASVVLWYSELRKLVSRAWSQRDIAPRHRLH